MKTGWTLIENQFEISTRGNYGKMLSIGNYTLAVLKKHSSDPFFLTLYNNYQPIIKSYGLSFNQFKVSLGKSAGGTLHVSQLLKKLSNPLIINWKAQIQLVYAKGSPGYVRLLPKGTKPFHNGSREERVSAVGTLIKAIGSDPALAALKAEVEIFYADVSTGRGKQLGSRGDKKNFSAEVEIKRLQVAIALMVVYGNLVVHYADQLERIEHFFDLETIRDKRQKTFTRKLKPHQSKTVVKRTLLPTDELKLQNTGTDDLLVCVCQGKKQICTTGFVLPASSTKTIAANLLGDVAELKYITITNTSELEGHCVITLL